MVVENDRDSAHATQPKSRPWWPSSKAANGRLVGDINMVDVVDKEEDKTNGNVIRSSASICYEKNRKNMKKNVEGGSRETRSTPMESRDMVTGMGLLEEVVAMVAVMGEMGAQRGHMTGVSSQIK